MAKTPKKAAGFNVVGTGNNHVADYGPKGLMDLLEELDDVQNVYANFDIPDTILDLVEA